MLIFFYCYYSSFICGLFQVAHQILYKPCAKGEKASKQLSAVIISDKMAQRISFPAFPSVFLSVLAYLYIRKAFQLPVTPQVDVSLFPTENSFMLKKSPKAGVYS